MKKLELYGSFTCIVVIAIILVFSVIKMMEEPTIVLGGVTVSLIVLISFLVSIFVYHAKSLKSKENNKEEGEHLYRLIDYIIYKYGRKPTLEEVYDIIHIVNNIKKKDP